MEAGAAGAVHPSRERAEISRVVQTLALVAPNETFAHRYGVTLVDIQRRSASTAAMDLLIATAALQERAQLLTANSAHFDVVPDLEVRTCR